MNAIYELEYIILEMERLSVATDRLLEDERALRKKLLEIVVKLRDEKGGRKMMLNIEFEECSG